MNLQIGTQLSVLSKEEISQLYSREDYNALVGNPRALDTKKRKRICGHVLEHLIAFRQSDQKILIQIEKVRGEKDYRVKMNGSENAHCLTSLHIAILTGRLKLIESLIKAGAHPERPDKQGWTPLHHAALRTDGTFEELLRCGANRASRNYMDGTPDQLRILAGIVPSRQSLIHLHYQKDLESFRVPASESHFNVFGWYTDEPICGIDKLRALWLTGRPEEALVHDLFDVICKKTYPTLYQKVGWENLSCVIRPCLQPTTEKVKETVYGIFAADWIDPMRFLGEIPRIEVSGVEMKTYPLWIGNHTYYFQDGFPNCYEQVIHNVGGLDRRNILVSGRGIENGEQLFLSMPEVDKWGWYRVPNSEAMRQFFSKVSLDSLMDVVEECSIMAVGTHQQGVTRIAVPLASVAEYHLRLDITQYLATTPAACIELLLRKIATPKAYLKVFEYYGAEDGVDVFEEGFTHMLQLHSLLELLIEELADLDAHLSSQILASLLEARNELTIKQQVKGLALVNHWLAKGNCTQGSWKTFSENLIQLLKNYDPDKDASFPLMKLTKETHAHLMWFVKEKLGECDD